MALSITAIYAGLLGLIAIVLAAMVGRARVATGVSLGDAGRPALLVAMRRQANFVEYVPLFVVLLAIVEINGAPRWWLHTLGSIVVAARIIHPFGLRHDVMRTIPRFLGTVGTFLPIVALSLTALWTAFLR
ncbi:MAG TPA: MAPEG family protein [Hyphomicrobiaceae bacterium]|nr:MAPEG family protein [Hyphomicrobiaceae bacterium]